MTIALKYNYAVAKNISILVIQFLHVIDHKNNVYDLSVKCGSKLLSLSLLTQKKTTHVWSFSKF